MSEKARKSIFNPTIIFLIVSVIMVIGLSFFAINLFASESSMTTNENESISSQIRIENGIQYASVDAKNGFYPEKINLKANTPAILTVKTDNTYDCSNYLNIPTLNISKQLPVTGETPINIPAQTGGTRITATCGMGHYPLYLNFVNG